MKIARIIVTYSEKYNVSLDEATKTFYESTSARMIENGVADLHCRSDIYLAEELWLEANGKQ